MYRYEPLTAENKTIWLETAGRCSYTPYNAVDEPALDFQLSQGAAQGNIIIYKKDGNEAIAILPGKTIVKKMKGLSLRVLSSNYGGILITDNHLHESIMIKEFVFCKVINSFYPKVMKIDIIEIVVPPIIMIENPSMFYKIIPLFTSEVEVNSFLYFRMEDKLIEKLKPPIRRDIRKGLRNMKNGSILNNYGDGDIFNQIMALDRQKSSKLRIEPLSDSRLKLILGSPLYNPIVTLVNGEAVACIIYTCYNKIGTFHYNASNEVGKRLEINKALMFLAMQDLYNKGVKYFLLGQSIERPTRDNIYNVTMFKKNFSSDEVLTFRLTYPMTYKGLFAIHFNRLAKKIKKEEGWWISKEAHCYGKASHKTQER